MIERLSIAEFENIFGRPCTRQVTVKMPVVGSFTCHELLVGQFREMFYEIEAAGLAKEIKNDGCFNCRKTKKIGGGYSSEWSRHAFGAAFDNWAARYPYGKTLAQPKALVLIYEKHGFFIPVKRDAMHAEFYKFVKGGLMPIINLAAVPTTILKYLDGKIEERAQGWVPFPGLDSPEATFHVPLNLSQKMTNLQVTIASGTNKWFQEPVPFNESAAGFDVFVRDPGKTNLRGGALWVEASVIY